MEKILQAMRRGHTVVTPTKRLARELLSAHGRASLAAGVQAWETPRVLPWPAWLAWLHRRLRWGEGVGATPRLLSRTQARWVWEAVLQESGLLPGNLPASALVKEVMQAWRLSAEYGIAAGEPERALNDNTHAFAQWSLRYRQRLSHRGWMDPDELPLHLARAGPRLGDLGSHVLVLSAGPLPGAWQALLDSLTAAGAIIEAEQLKAQPGEPSLHGAENAEDEFRLAATWARDWLEAKPDARLAIVINNLDQCRRRVGQILAEELAPVAQLPGRLMPLPFHLSMGSRLAEVPLVSQALALLGWLAGSHHYTVAGRVLRGKHLAPSPEVWLGRHVLDAAMREEGWMQAEPARVLSLQRQRSLGDEAMERLLQAQGTAGDGLPSAWAERFAQWLSLAGWPGFPELTSDDYQAREAWRDLLGEFSSLDPVVGTLEALAAVGKLAHLARERVFQPESADVPVQVLDPREAQGLRFDGAWVCGWHDEAWPQPVHPSPFLPLSEQRKLGLPGADAEQRYREAERVREQLTALAPECVFSWPGSEDGRPLRPSALVRHLPPGRREVATAPPYRLQMLQSRVLEPRPQPDVPAISPDTLVAGGVRVLENQSACPFRAFAEHRLGARPLDSPRPGIDPRQRGLGMHRAMEHIWEQLRGRRDLLAMDGGSRQALVRESVSSGFAQVRANGEPACRARLLELERRRAEGLILRQLVAEERRSDFVVKEQESGRESEFGGLRFKVRPDRIDRVQDGREIVLDYKTGAADAAGWLRERLGSVQLPMYALSDPRQVRGAFFVSLRPGGACFLGMQADADLIPPDPDTARLVAWDGKRGYASWEDMLLAWREKLGSLAAEFRDSVRRVDPAPGACEYCHLETLCRVADKRGVSEDD